MVKLTHPDRLYWPDAGVTKEGLADYYAEIFRYAAPFIVGRPLALLRCPDGIDGQQFFQKHPWKGMGSAILPVEDPKGETAIAIKDLDGMISLAQGAVLEIHPWGSTLADWERPDILIMDLDPGDGVAWEKVIAAAREIRDRMERAGLTAFVKTSGGKGLHVAAPLKPQAEWPAVKNFRQILCRRHGRRSSGRLCLRHSQGAAAGKNPHRLFAQPARRDRHRALWRTGAARRARLDAARLGGAESGDRSGAFHHRQRADAARQFEQDAMGKLPRSRRAAGSGAWAREKESVS